MSKMCELDVTLAKSRLRILEGGCEVGRRTNLRYHDIEPRRSLWRRRLWIWRSEEWFPNVDVSERKGKVVVWAYVPGTKRDDIDIFVQGGTLVIQGRRDGAEKRDNELYYRCERALPGGISAEAMEVKHQNGVLEITIPFDSSPEAA
ncbi:MAG: Hsp20/alpha crystallin family protein [Chloroflexi bacterium]|nr:Hsp20/alpha crystallin family protein [Chloroflexota bacterium]